MQIRMRSITTLALVVFLAAGATTAQAGLQLNGLQLNGIAFNALSFNGLTMNGLGLNGLGLQDQSLRFLSQQPIAAEVTAE